MFRKIISVMLSLTLVVGLAIPAFATESETTTSVDGMDQFMELTAAGTIYLDVESALDAGYDEMCVNAVATHIANMNQLVINGNAYIDDTFTATVYFVSPRAKGESKVVTHWYGLTEIYMNSDEADELISNLSTIGDVATVGGVFSFFSNAILGAIGNVAGIIGIGTLIYRWQVEAAAEPGTGIIMHIQTNFVDGSQTIWFTAQ